MKIEKFVCGYLRENCYVIYFEENALIVDPGSNEEEIDGFLKKNNLILRGILVTHYHFDHTGALNYFKEKYNPKIYDYEDLGLNKTHGFMFEVFDTKGHTNDSCSFFFEEINSMFVGDFLFKGSIGRYDFENSSFTDMQKSIAWIKSYDKSLIVYPGHGDKTTLGHELKNNEFLK